MESRTAAEGRHHCMFYSLGLPPWAARTTESSWPMEPWSCRLASDLACRYWHATCSLLPLTSSAYSFNFAGSEYIEGRNLRFVCSPFTTLPKTEADFQHIFNIFSISDALLTCPKSIRRNSLTLNHLAVAPVIQDRCELWREWGSS